MKHFTTINPGASTLADTAKTGGCGNCKASCQSACKTSCTVANQPCERYTADMRNTLRVSQ
ncbi:six-cysteine peptide SCIFF [Clostridia bacterium]|nr:six-cysteine peptide SCIFF [Clostridia bacterium]